MQKISIGTRIGSLLLSVSVALLGLLGSTRPAAAIPSFARQTGMPCASCHVGWPELTPFGRAFKANGYVWNGGQHPFPLSVMLQAPVFTHTATDQPEGAAPGFGANDNFEVEAVSLFYGGAIYAPIGLGAFVQATYSGVDNAFSWDNADIRLAKSITPSGFGGAFSGTNFVLGLTVNNNPTMSDLWNTTPAWRFPFVGPDLAPAPTAATLIEGGLGQEGVGVGPYVWWNNLIYMELEGYRTLPNGTLKALGVGTPITPIHNISPYWRVAVTPSWGNNNLEIGTFGLSSELLPGGIIGFGTDQLTDVGIDTQYQYISGKQFVSLQASYITEWQNWAASQPLELTANKHDRLNSFNIKASYMYDRAYEGTIGFFSITGNHDPGLYAPDPIDGSANGSPNSRGFVFEFDWMPWNYGAPWPYSTLGLKLGVQYTLYTQFNGGSSNYDGFGRNASDNNTFLAFAWFMF
jgi:hypothetical protein